MSGRIICFEGVDGSGKSTLVNEVQKALVEQQETAKQFAFPTHDGLIGSFIREELFTGALELENDRAWLHLMLGDLADQDDKVHGFCQEYDWLLLDRYPAVSAWAYQGPNHTVAELAAATDMNLYASAPEVIFILDVPAEVSLERRAKRNDEANPVFEKDLEYAEGLRTRYAAYAGMYLGSGPIVLLDGTLPTAELVAEVLQVLDALD